MPIKYDKDVLKKGIHKFREGYLSDIARFGEDYWKEKILNTFGQYEASGVMWDDYYGSEISEALDKNCPSILVLAKIIIEEY